MKNYLASFELGEIIVILVIIGFAAYYIYDSVVNYDPTNPNTSSGGLGGLICDVDVLSTCGKPGSNTNQSGGFHSILQWLDSELGTCTSGEGGACSE